MTIDFYLKMWYNNYSEGKENPKTRKELITMNDKKIAKEITENNKRAKEILDNGAVFACQLFDYSEYNIFMARYFVSFKNELYALLFSKEGCIGIAKVDW